VASLRQWTAFMAIDHINRRKVGVHGRNAPISRSKNAFIAKRIC